MVSFVFVYFGCNQYKEDCAYSTEHGMRHLMHVITVGCIDIYENVQESWLDIHLKILFKNIWYEYWHQFYRIALVLFK